MVQICNALGGLQFCTVFEPFSQANYSSALFLNLLLILPPHVPTAQSSCESKVHNTFDDEIMSAVKLCLQLGFVVQLKSVCGMSNVLASGQKHIAHV